MISSNMSIIRISAHRVGATLMLAGLLGGTASAQSSKTLSVGVASAPQTMNPQGSDSDPNMSIVTNIFDGLLRRNNDGKLEPDLATSWKRINSTTWQFHLRKGVKFNNGNDFTWKDVRFTMKRLRDPQVSEYLNFGSLIKSVKPVDGDVWTIDIKTTSSVPFFAQNLPQIFIMDKESTESRSQGEVGLHPIGTGAYRMVKWVKGSFLKLEANGDYWGKKPSIKNVTVRPITEVSTRMAAISSGQVDILQGVPASLVQVIKRNPQIKLEKRPARRAIFLQLGNKKGSPTADIRVRRAMYMAIDEKAIINKILLGHATPAAQIPDPPTIGYSKSIKRLPYDPKKAGQLLKEAGYPGGFTITLTGMNERNVQKQIEATIASQLSKVGIKVKVNSIPRTVFYPKLAEHKANFYMFGWFDGAYDFGRTFGKLFHSVNSKKGYGGLNGTSYSSKALDNQFAKADSITDPSKRKKALQKLNEMTANEVAFIPLHYKENDYAIRKGKGIKFMPRADTWLVFKNMTIGGQ